MAYAIEEQSATRIVIAARAPYAELEALFAKAAKRISEATDIEGFRKGKAPYDAVRAKFGEFKILEAAARLWIQQKFAAIMDEVAIKEFKSKSFEPIGEPEIAITKLTPGEDAEYRITLAILPGLELPDYRAIARRVLAGKRVPKISEDEISSAREWLRESRATLITVARGAALGDRVEIDFSAAVGGVAVEGGGSKAHPLILGQGRLVPGFEDKLVGMKAGEETTFTLAIPTDYRDAAIAGKAVAFKVKMDLVQERRLPEWNDDFAKSIGNFSSAEAAVQSIRDGLVMEKGGKERERLRMAMLDAIASETKAELPAVLLERELDKMAAELEASSSGMGLSFDEYLTHIKQDRESLRKEWRGNAARRVKIALILREIAKRENIRPSDEEVQALENRTIEREGLSREDIKNLDRQAFSDYHRGIARNEQVLLALENTA